MLGGVATKYLQHGDSRTGYEKLSVHEGLEFVEWVLWRKHRSHGMDVLAGCPMGRGSVGVVVVGAQPIIVLLSTTKVLRWEWFRANHRAERWNRELLECIRAMPWNFTSGTLR